MSTEILHATLHLWMSGPGSRFAHETREALLAQAIEQLSSLRSSVLHAADAEADPREEPRRRVELRRELEQLRRTYRAKIDAIATSFGVDAAMKAKEKVERTVTALPAGVVTPEGEEDYRSRAGEDVSKL